MPGRSFGSIAAHVVRVAQHGKRRHGEAVAGEERLFADPVLRDGDTGGRRRHARRARQEFQRGGRHVLEFGRGRARDGGQVGKRVRIEVVGADVAVGDRAGGAVAARVEHGDLVAQALGRHAEHPAELAAAQQAEPGAGRDGFIVPSQGDGLPPAGGVAINGRNHVPASRRQPARASRAPRSSASGGTQRVSWPPPDRCRRG